MAAYVPYYAEMDPLLTRTVPAASEKDKEQPAYTPVGKPCLDDGGCTTYLYERLARVSYWGEPADALVMILGSQRLLIGLLQTPVLPDSAPSSIELKLAPQHVNGTGDILLKPLTRKSLEDLCTSLTKQGFSVSPHPQSGMYTVR